MTDAEDFQKVFNDPNSPQRARQAQENIAHMERVVDLMPPEYHALEIGAFKGGMTIWLLEHGAEQVQVVDPFTGSPEHQGVFDCEELQEEFEKNTAAYEERILVIAEKSEVALPSLIDAGAIFDLIYVDGSHDSQDVILDAVLGLQLLKKGGVMVFDDYRWSYYENEFRNPKPAIDFFIKAFSDKITILETGYQVSLRKL